jgi:riboflavin synthase
MFTGIITDIGRVRSLEHRGDLHARIATGYDTSGIDIGASIACNGVCLTVTETGGTGST